MLYFYRASNFPYREAARFDCIPEVASKTELETMTAAFFVYSAQRLDLFAWNVRLSRLLVGFRTHFKSLHFRSSRLP